MKKITKTQKYYLSELQLIGGKPEESWGLSRFGENIKIWVWHTRAWKSQTQLLVLADKAREFGLKTFVMRKYKKYPSSGNYTYDVVDPSGSLEKVNMVTVWCPEL